MGVVASLPLWRDTALSWLLCDASESLLWCWRFLCFLCLLFFLATQGR